MLISQVFSAQPLNIEFRRVLSGNNWDRWVHLVLRLMQVRLSEEPDKFVWDLNSSGLFSVKSLYHDLVNDHTVFLRKYIWKMKVPLKIKIFMWFLYKKVILTKDNLAKRKWKGCLKCEFCDSTESIEHLLISCPLARFIWRIVEFTFNLPPPANITNMFGNWLRGMQKIDKARVRVGVCAILRSLWTCRNDLVFNRTKHMNYLQVIHKDTSLLGAWSFEHREAVASRCGRLETVARAFYNFAGWQIFNRLNDA